MINRSGKVLGAVLLAVALVTVAGFTVAGSAEAGVVYTDETSFNNDLAAGLTPNWTENFESFGGAQLTNPLLVAGGMAEIASVGASLIDNPGPTGSSWLGSGPVTVRGVGNTGLGVQAISFNFGNDGVQTVSFVSSGGTDSSAPYAPSNYATENFVGWIGSGSETAVTAQFSQGGGILLDNIDGYIAHAPEPGTFLLFGIGAVGLFFAGRRRKSKSAK